MVTVTHSNTLGKGTNPHKNRYPPPTHTIPVLKREQLVPSTQSDYIHVPATNDLIRQTNAFKDGAADEPEKKTLNTSLLLA